MDDRELAQRLSNIESKIDLLIDSIKEPTEHDTTKKKKLKITKKEADETE